MTEVKFEGKNRQKREPAGDRKRSNPVQASVDAAEETVHIGFEFVVTYRRPRSMPMTTSSNGTPASRAMTLICFAVFPSRSATRSTSTQFSLAISLNAS
jgi:hypothetical protein